MNELVPAILMALSDHRIEDFVSLSETLLEECDDQPVQAMAEVAQAALFLHRHPRIPIGLLAAMNQSDIDETSLLHGQIQLEILDVIEGLDGNGRPSPEGSEILSRFDMRPGSAEVMAGVLRTFTILLSTMQMEFILNRHDPNADADVALRRAIAQTRAVIQENLPPS